MPGGLRHQAAEDLFFAIFILALVVARSWFRAYHEDLHLYDETLYLHHGLHAFERMPPADWAPLYAFWYGLWSKIVPDPIRLYYFNWSLLLATNLALVRLILRAVGMQRIPIILILAWFAFMDVHNIPPSVTSFSMVFAGFAVLGVLRAIRPARGLCVAACWFVLSAFVRPESLATALAILLATVYLAMRQRERWQETLFLSVLPILLFGLLLVGLGNPLKGYRPLIAFGQHYAINVHETRRPDVDPWKDWSLLTRPAFGSADSPWSAAQNNPEEFLWHVGRNVRSTAIQAVRQWSPDLEGQPTLAMVLAGLFAGLLITGWWRVVRSRKRVVVPSERIVALMWLTACVLGTTLLVSLIIYPRPHYLMASILPLLTLAGMGLAGKHPGRPLTMVIVAVALILIMPGEGILTPWWTRSWTRASEPVPPNLAMAQCLQTLPAPTTDRRVVFEYHFDTSTYARWQGKPRAVWQCKTFASCSTGAQVILLDAELRRYFTNHGDETLERFLQDPKAAGFRLFCEPGPDSTVFVRM